MREEREAKRQRNTDESGSRKSEKVNCNTTTEGRSELCERTRRMGIQGRATAAGEVTFLQFAVRTCATFANVEWQNASPAARERDSHAQQESSDIIDTVKWVKCHIWPVPKDKNAMSMNIPSLLLSLSLILLLLECGWKECPKTIFSRHTDSQCQGEVLK